MISFVVLPTILSKITALTSVLIWITLQTFSINHLKMFHGMNFVITSAGFRNSEIFRTVRSTAPFPSFVFFFTLYVLHKPWDDTQLPMRKFDTYLPYVLTRNEVQLFLGSLPTLKQKAMVSLMYSSGLRIGEVCRLKYGDIQRSSMRIHVSKTKNRSDRYTLLSQRALDILTEYWYEYDRPMDWLFFSKTRSAETL